MEPLSIGASVIAVVGATGKLIKGIRRLKALSDAPRELDNLLAEVSQFELIIQAIRNTNENGGLELKTLLKTATNILVDFESLIEYHLTEAGTSKKVDRWQWTHKSKDVERLRGKLQDVTANLVALVGVNASTTIHQVAQTTNQVLAEQRQLSDQILPKINLLFQLLEESPSTRAALNGSLGNVRQLTLQPPSRENDIVAETTQRITYQEASAAPRIQSQITLSITKVQKIRECDLFCACKCHFSTTRGARGIPPKIFGHGYVETAGFGFPRTRCDTKSCRAHAAPHVLVQYCLPQWLASRMIQMWFTSSPPCGPEFLLRVPRVMMTDNLAIRAVHHDDMEMLKVAITRGDCTPYDVDEYGDNLMTMAARCSQWGVLLHLYSCEDFRTSSCLSSSAEHCILEVVFNSYPTVLFTPRNFAQIPVLTEVMPIIDWEYHAKMQSLTALHRSVCGISGVSIDIELQDSTNINELDKKGRSALWFAVRNQNLTHVRKLLERGSDPNIGEPPLWIAAILRNYDTMRLLLDHGASLDPDLIPVGQDGWLPWPPADESEDSFAIDQLLIRSGISINHPASRGVTILMHPSSYSCLRAGSILPRLRQLISSGADLEITDEEGQTALMYAVSSAFPKAFRILAGAGARLDRKTVRGSTILHLAIVGTSVFYLQSRAKKLCEAMHDADLTSVNLDAKDEDGNTAHDLLRMRNGPNWDGYCRSKDKGSWYDHEDWQIELKAVEALEKLLHHVQEIQGVPEADRYPPLGEYGRRDPEDQPVPGAWPAYAD